MTAATRKKIARMSLLSHYGIEEGLTPSLGRRVRVAKHPAELPLTVRAERPDHRKAGLADQLFRPGSPVALVKHMVSRPPPRGAGPRARPGGWGPQVPAATATSSGRRAGYSSPCTSA